jgi:hypothetical protein
VLYVCKSGRTAQAVVTVSDTGPPVSTRRETAVQPGTLTRPELTAADRCDRCGAAAKIRAILPSGGELLFCGHHGRAHAAKLRELEAHVQTGS